MPFYTGAQPLCHLMCSGCIGKIRHSSVTPEAFPSTCSNRSAALLQLRKSGKALEDAEQCIKRRPDWDKGFYRKGLALELAGKTSEVGVITDLSYPV